jgi:signal transduction histidine kinase
MVADDGKPDPYERLLAQYTEIARLAGALAHEIKNPLSTIRLNMELLAEDLEEAQTPAQRRAVKRVGVMQRECQRLQDLLDNFLNFAKVRQLNLQPTDLNAEIAETLDFFAPQAKAGGVELVRYFDPELPRVMLDE